MRRWLAEAARRFDLWMQGRRRFPCNYDQHTGDHIVFDSYNPFTDEVTYRVWRYGCVYTTRRKPSRAFGLYYKTFGAPFPPPTFPSYPA